MKSFYVKFVVITIGIMIFSSILAFLISNTYYQQKLKPDNDEKITKIALEIAAFVNDHPEIELDEYLTNLSTIGYQFYLVGDTGKSKFFGSPFREKVLSDRIIEQVWSGETYHGIRHFPQETFVTGFFANELTNTIGVPLTHHDNSYALFLRPDIKLLFNEMHLLFGWLLILTIILSIFFVLLSTKYLVKPISKLTTATKSLAYGNYDVELETKRYDELGELSRSFYHMAKKLEQTEETRQEFISNISHDIQSPLANIKGYTTLLKSANMDQADRQRYISIVNDEITRLSSLTKQLLLLTSLDRHEDIMKKERFNLGWQIKALIRHYQWKMSEKNIMLSYALPDIHINGDPSLLETVWDNLLTNAIKYNKLDGSIDIMLEQKEAYIVLTFKDTGIGIHEIERDKIFDRFYRVDQARSREIEGTGLGLSIVRTIIRMHDGRIRVSSQENEGSTFVVELPLYHTDRPKNSEIINNTL